MPRPAQRAALTCPFCRGNEAETPEEVARYGAPGAAPADWQVRVVPNKFPAVRPAAEIEKAAFQTAGPLYPTGTSGLGRRQPASGVHEVIVESPDHVARFSELSDLQIELSFAAYRDRLFALQREPQLTYALVFKNTGVDAGASLEHVHSQLIALPQTPPEVQYELTKAGEHLALHGNPLMADVLAAEVADGRRILIATDAFTVYCPAASRLPFETWIVPRRPAPRFELEAPEMIVEAAHLVRDVVVRFEERLTRPAHNFWIHSAPIGDESGRIHWRIELAPRLATMAGFEFGSGCFINPIAPEVAAKHLQ